VAHKYLLSVVIWLATSLSAATLDGMKIHSSTSGQGPRTVILVHGYTCDETTWSEQVPALAKEYRVVTLDLPGHGKSDSPKDGRFSMDLFARAVEAARAEINAGRVVLVGHSLGTPVILRYAHLSPQHTSALVFAEGLMPPSREQAAAAANFAAAVGGPNGRSAREALVRGFFVAGTPATVQTKVLNMMLAAPEATAVGALNAARELFGQTMDVPAVPMLGIYAAPKPTASAEVVHAFFPTAEYTQIPDTGHFLMLEKPDEFNRILLGFLAKQKY
jgi:pimeloyl-ACP methyl ester carboxylesterase